MKDLYIDSKPKNFYFDFFAFFSWFELNKRRKKNAFRNEI